MYRIISVILVTALLMLCVLPTGAISSDNAKMDMEISEDVEFSHTVGNVISSDGGSQDVEMYHTVLGGYIITIPESITLTKSGPSISTVEISQVNVGGGTVNVSISSENYDGTWNLTSRAGTLAYSIQADGNELQNNGIVLSCPDGTRYASKDISFELTDATPKTVSYTDTLTFNVSVDE